MFELYDSETGELVGEINHDQLELLMEALADGVVGDREYRVDATRLDGLESEIDDGELIEVFREALGDRSEFHVRWEPA